MARIFRIFPFLIGVVVAVVALNTALGAQHFPIYGSWTGIRPLEDKLRKLDTFAGHGQVDALIVGSSISDFGIDAHLLSDEMTAATHQPYRAFNFSTGGTELTTMPILYRLARTVTKPRTLLISLPEEIRRGDAPNPASPDYALDHAPIGTAIRDPRLFSFEKWFWDEPLVRDAAPLRDRLVFGDFKNLAAQGSDLYAIDSYGDSLSYSYQTTRQALAYLRNAHITAVTPLTPHEWKTMSERAKLRHYFNDVDIAAVNELLKLTKKDGCKIVLIAHDVSSDYYPRPLERPAFTRARRQFFTVLSRYMHTRLVYEVEKFKAAKYMVMDDVHLNHYGAQAFTRLVANGLSNGAVPRVRTPLRAFPTLTDVPSTDPTVSNFSALIDPPTEPGATTLHLTLLRNKAIPPLPDAPLKVLIRLPSNKDLAAPVRLTDPTDVVAHFRSLPPSRRAMYLARLVYVGGGRLNAPNQPIADYWWSK